MISQKLGAVPASDVAMGRVAGVAGSGAGVPGKPRLTDGEGGGAASGVTACCTGAVSRGVMATSRAALRAGAARTAGAAGTG